MLALSRKTSNLDLNPKEKKNQKRKKKNRGSYSFLSVASARKALQRRNGAPSVLQAFTVFFYDSLPQNIRNLYPTDRPNAVTPGFIFKS